jgi:hypothetical protein
MGMKRLLPLGHAGFSTTIGAIGAAMALSQLTICCARSFSAVRRVNLRL